MRSAAAGHREGHHLLHSDLWCRLAFGMRAALRYAAAPETQQQFQAMLIAASLLFLPSAAAAARRSDSVPPAAQPARRAFARGLRARAPARPQQTSLLWIAVAPSYQCGIALHGIMCAMFCNRTGSRPGSHSGDQVVMLCLMRFCLDLGNNTRRKIKKQPAFIPVSFSNASTAQGPLA